MPRTLSEVTLDHSRRLSELQADCRQRRARLDREKDAALGALPGAQAFVQQADASRIKAAEALARVLVDADIKAQAARAKAAERLNEALSDVDQKYRAADRVADAKRDAATRAANAAYADRIDAIGRLPIEKQFGAREEAQRDLREALAKADAAWRAARDASRDTQQAGLQAATDRERQELESAAATLALSQAAARQIHDHDVRMAQARLDQALATLPGAEPILDQHDAGVAALAADCRATEEDLFAEFRRALDELRDA